MKTLPKELMYGYLGHVADETRAQVFGDFRPASNNSETAAESKRIAVLKGIADLRSVYSAATVTYEPFCLGIRDAILYFENVLSTRSLETSIPFCKKTYDERLCPPIEHIRAAFLSHNSLSVGRLLDQDEVEVNQVEAYVYGCRESLRYVLALAMEVLRSSDGKTPVRIIACQLNKTTHPPNFNQIDLTWQGWTRADKFIRDCTQQENSDALDPTRYEELLAERENFIFFVETLRTNPTMFYIFKLGFGFHDLKPKKSNRVFDCTIPAADVPTADLVELINLHAQASSRPSPTTWLK